MSQPIIVFGQQPNGFFPKRFFVSKIWTARRLQSEIGGEIVCFFHDCDHDPRETQTKLRALKGGSVQAMNFSFENKIQRKFSPLSLKRISPEWQANVARQLPNFVKPELVELFKSIQAKSVADFCLEMYKGMGLFDGIRVERSGDSAFREQAIEVDDCFVDVEYKGEIVRARRRGEGLVLHQGGSSFLELPPVAFGKSQVTPTRDTRLAWMQSVLHCTHYVAGASEIDYLNTADAPEIEFVERDPIDRLDEAYVGE